MFSLDDKSIQYPHAQHQRVPSEMNIIYSFAIPLATMVAWSLIFRPGLHKAHVTILGLFISLVLSTFLTDVVKNAIGRPRPDLIARCKPAKGTPEHTLITVAVCTETDHHTLHDGWRSFPSGHSSFAFAGLGYLAIWVSGQMHVFRPRTDLARVLVALAPFLGAAMIAMSRLADYRHDVYDVSVGSVLGISIAYFSYRRYYPSLKTARCHEPFPSRAEVALAFGKGKARDDEEQQQRIRGAGEFELEDLDEGDDDEVERVPLTEIRGERSRQLNRGLS